MTGAAQRPFNSWDALKLLAIAMMFVDHAGAFIYTDVPALRAFGRTAAPLFLFLAGYAASYRFKWDLLLLALAMSISDFLLTGHLRTQNILVTILLIRMVFAWHEKRGMLVQRPYEWYIGSVALYGSMVITQYGSFGLLFALCGYMQRRPEHYTEKLRWNFWVMTYIAYAILLQVVMHFTPLYTVLMVLSLAATFFVLWRFRITQTPYASLPQRLLQPAKLIARYSGYIYAFHLIALEWLTGIAF